MNHDRAGYINYKRKNPLINILIRTMPGREAMLKKCIDSIRTQTYRNHKIRIHEDTSTDKFPFHYNLFCNTLKALVTEGWFMYVDDDDFMHEPGSLQQIAKDLTNPNEAVICQFIRGTGRVKPSGGNIRNKEIISGKIGMPCLILHHSQKHIADIQALDNGDYLWIKEVCTKIPFKFVEKIVVNSPKRNYGI